MSDDKTMRELIDDIEAVRGTLMDPSRAVAMERLAKRGTLSARTRIDRLLDRESFSEIGALVAAEESAAAPPPARTLSPADGVVVGTGMIDGRPVVVFSQDFAVFGGSTAEHISNISQKRLFSRARSGSAQVCGACAQCPSGWNWSSVSDASNSGSVSATGCSRDWRRTWSMILCLRMPVSQVFTDDLPEKRAAPSIAAISVSCTASSAAPASRSCSEA